MWSERALVRGCRVCCVDPTLYRFPDIGYFRDPDVQTHLTNILFLYSVTHADIGYRQGMHELLAPLYYAVDYDSIPEDDTEGGSEVQDLCSRAWVAADAWALFSQVMRHAGQWYEWRETKHQSREHSPLPSHININVLPCRTWQASWYLIQVL